MYPVVSENLAVMYFPQFRYFRFPEVTKEKFAVQKFGSVEFAQIRLSPDFFLVSNFFEGRSALDKFSKKSPFCEIGTMR